MPAVLTLLMTLTLVPWQAQVDVDDEVVRLLISEDPASELSTVSGDGDGGSGWHRLEIPLRGSIERTIAAVEAATGARVILEQRYDLFAPQDDPLFDEQWHHENTAQDGGISDADIDSTNAWGSSLGNGVVVAVVDSGVNMSHEDLTSQIWANPGEVLNGVDDDGNGLVDDQRGWDMVGNDNDPSPSSTVGAEGHGTAVAGIISAAANGLGVVGVAPESQVMVIRSCSEGACWSLDIADGISYAVDEGAHLINLSLGSITSGDDALEDAIAYARSRDVLVVTAAGNESIDLDSLPQGQQLIPGGLPFSNILTVAASDRSDSLAGFSNYGPDTVDIVAPGVDVVTTDADGDYTFADGTSFSSPIVAGVAALLLSDEPGTGHQELFARISAFVDKPSGVAGATASGRVNAGKVLTLRFIDTSSSVFVEAIDWLAEMGITEGCNPPWNHQFCPSQRVTRGEMAVFLSRAFGLPATGTDYFSDDEGAFYEGSANRLAAAGLTVGCGADIYCGEDDIRRDEIAAMLARALYLPATGTDFFADDEGSVFENAINKVAAAGVTQGCNPPANTNFCPARDVTRGEMAAFIKRSVELSG